MIITNIQRFSLHDGPGIRTTVFLKGCSLYCPWCANPENIEKMPQVYVKNGKESICGREYTTIEVFDEVVKDKQFYENGGGVTFSGGEPLLQIEELIPLIDKLTKNGISTAVETSLFVPEHYLNLAIDCIDLFYVDMKILDYDKCRYILGGDLTLYLNNLSVLHNSNKKFVVRIPVIGGYTADCNNIKKVIDLLNKYSDDIIGVELIKEHNLGMSKYISLGYSVPDYEGVSDDLMLEYKQAIERELHLPIIVCKI